MLHKQKYTLKSKGTISLNSLQPTSSCLAPNFTKLFSYSTELSMKFQLLVKTKMLNIKILITFLLSDVVFIMLINVKMPTIDGILTFMSMIDFMLN